MKPSRLTSMIWFRAQGIYAAGGIGGATVFAFYQSLSGGPGGDGAISVAAIVSVFGLVLGLPAWAAWCGVMEGIHRFAGWMALYPVTWLVTGLLATALALSTGFDLFLGGMLNSHDREFVRWCSIPAYIALAVSAATLRRDIRSWGLAPESSVIDFPDQSF